LFKSITTPLIFGLLSLSAATPALAFTTSYLASGYSASLFATLDVNTRAFTLDSSNNIFTSSALTDGTGQVKINELTASSGYSASSQAYSYATTSATVSGLDFHGTQLLVSEADASGNSGKITDATTGNTVIALTTFRPTSIDARGNILFAGRQKSNLSFGNIYSLDSSNNLSTVFSNEPFRGIATNAAGDIFVSTTSGNNSSSFLANSIYELTAASSFSASSAKLIATIGDGGSTELSFDNAGNLLALYTPTGISTGVQLVSIAAVPEADTYSMALMGLGMMGFVMRRRKSA
jgi:hypothetical protein